MDPNVIIAADMKRIQGILIDLDGVIYNDTVLIPGARAAIAWLQQQGMPFRFLTNTTMKSRFHLRQKLAQMGIHVAEKEIFSAAYAGAQFVRQRPGATCHLLISEAAKSEYAGLESAAERVDYVVAGDLGEALGFSHLNAAFQRLYHGAQLIALQKNRYWISDAGVTLDAGAFVALLEYAANTSAILIGKPAPGFFRMALQDLNLPAENVMMIGDDIESDIAGARALGICSVLVQTGKFRAQDLERNDIQPDLILPSIQSLPELNTVLF